jgi:succinate dehydrogenase / fumarate reductase flavoprotein subunit
LSEKKSDTFFKLRDSLGKELFEKAGIFRDKEGLEKLEKSIDEMKNSFETLTLNDKSWLVSHLKFENSLEVAYAVVLSAKNREESRGAHYRDDFKNTNNKALHSFIDNSLHVRSEV